MNVFKSFQTQLHEALHRLMSEGALKADLAIERTLFEPPRDESHGDLATNAAMVLAKQAGMKPRDLAEILAAEFRGWDGVETVEIAGPGFINLRLSNDFWHGFLKDVLAAGDAYGKSKTGQGVKVNVEYVSTNPTGPLHIGHVRGAVIGDVLAAMYEATGHDVVREYYVNDAGTQVDVLARSAHLRYQEALGQEIEIPDGMYPGDYLIPVGQKLAQEFGDKWLNAPEAEWLDEIREIAVEAMLDLIRRDLAAMGIEQIYSSERKLVEDGKVQSMLDRLTEQGLIYTGQLPPPKGKPDEDWEPRDQLLLKTTDFGDKTDRALVKSDGTFTYFTTDVAYHLDKIERGSDVMVDVWGADHHGHVERMQAAIKAASKGTGNKEAKFDVLLCNLVKLLRDGKEVKMSKRAGTLVMLDELLEEVSADIVRFMILTRRSSENLNFDLKKAVEQSMDNPLFYVQYAHARIQSVIHKAQAQFSESLSLELLESEKFDTTNFSILGRPEELAAIRKLAAWPRLLETATEAQEPHRVVFFLMDVAASFHSLWSAGRGEDALRFIVEGDLATTQARLSLLVAIRQVIRSGLGIIGVEPISEM